MKIEKVGSNKIKVTISMRDLEERNIDLNSLNYNSPAAQELFWDMMEQAELKFGFNASDSQLCIEASPDSEEGFIVFITKLEDEEDFESIQKYIKNRFKRADLRVKKKSCKISPTVMIYSFIELEDICALSKRIYPMFSGDSSLYKYKNFYYLVLTKNNLAVANQKIFENILNEYGTKIVNTNYYEGILSERGTKMIDYNAIEILSSYF